MVTVASTGAADKVWIVKETLDRLDSISVVAAAMAWRQRFAPVHARRGSVSVAGDDEVTSNKVVRQL